MASNKMFFSANQSVKRALCIPLNIIVKLWCLMKYMFVYDPRLIEEAKLRYPIGTIYKSAWRPQDYGTCRIGGNNFFQDSFGYKIISYFTGERYIDEEDSSGSVYYKGKWAEIISMPDNRPQYNELEEARKVIYKD